VHIFYKHRAFPKIPKFLSDVNQNVRYVGKGESSPLTAELRYPHETGKVFFESKVVAKVISDEDREDRKKLPISD
jgi:hypothetical protein